MADLSTDVVVLGAIHQPIAISFPNYIVIGEINTIVSIMMHSKAVIKVVDI